MRVKLQHIVGYVYRVETRRAKQWLTDICYEFHDGRRKVLTAGPRVDRDLKQIISSHEIADWYLDLSPVTLVDNTDEEFFRAEIATIKYVNRWEETTWQRTVWLNSICTRWRRKLGKL